MLFNCVDLLWYSIGLQCNYFIILHIYFINTLTPVTVILTQFSFYLELYFTHIVISYAFFRYPHILYLTSYLTG